MKTFALCASAALVLSAAGLFAMPASAANATQAACSQQYQAAKSAGTLNGQKWSDFYHTCAAGMKTSGASATQTPVATAPAVAAPKLSKAKAAAATTAAVAPAAMASSGKTTSQICSGQYQAAKAAGTLNGQKWGSFLSSCAASIRNYSDSQAQAPSEPPAVTRAQARTIAATQAAIPAVDANGKPLSPGEVAFRQRIHACSQEWQSEKASGTLPAGSKWPQFWSACNSQLKQQG